MNPWIDVNVRVAQRRAEAPKNWVRSAKQGYELFNFETPGMNLLVDPNDEEGGEG